VCTGLKRKREEYDESSVDECLSLLQTSVSKLHRTPLISVRGRRRSTSLRRSVLIFNMLHTLQNDCTEKSRARWHRANIMNASCVMVESELDDEESLDEWKHCVAGEVSSFSTECNVSNDRSISASASAHSEIRDSIVQFDYEFFEAESLPGMEQNSMPEKTSEPLNGVLHESSWQQAVQVPCLIPDAIHVSSSQTQPFLPEEMFDLEASLFDFDCLNAYLNTSKDSSKEIVSRAACGEELDLLDGDLEYLMQVFVNS